MAWTPLKLTIGWPSLSNFSFPPRTLHCALSISTLALLHLYPWRCRAPVPPLALLYLLFHTARASTAASHDFSASAFALLHRIRNCLVTVCTPETYASLCPMSMSIRMTARTLNVASYLFVSSGIIACGVALAQAGLGIPILAEYMSSYCYTPRNAQSLLKSCNLRWNSFTVLALTMVGFHHLWQCYR